MAYTNQRQKRGYTYPSPYMDIAGTWYPSTVKELFRWCRVYFNSNPIVNSTISKLSEYPITEFVYELESADNDSKLVAKEKKRAKKIIEKKLKMRSFLLEAGLDYYTYGNAFVSIYTPFKRYLICPKCKERYAIDQVEYSIRLFKFKFDCKKCSSNGVIAKVDDVPVRDMDRLNFVRWNPENIQVDYNEISGNSVYYYRIPNKLRNDIIRGKKIIIEEVPIKILEALEKRRDLKIDPNNIFHFKRPTLAETDMGWGKPIILSVMKDIFYLQTMRKAQEAIAIQHIVPFDILFPQQSGSVDPYTHVDLSSWKGKINEELSKWKQDPNYISIMPIPVGVSRIGGDGRMLLITPEIESTLKSVSAGFGVPLEFLFGGLSWSGSSVSLRTLENHFLTSRTYYQDFIDWAIDKIKHIAQFSQGLSVSMVEFKMADDVQQKQLYVNMNQTRKISDKTLLTKMGVNYEEELENLKKQVDDQNELLKKETLANAVANGEAQKINMNFQMEIQDEQRKKARDQQAELSRSSAMANAQINNAIDPLQSELAPMPPMDQPVPVGQAPQQGLQQAPQEEGTVNQDNLETAPIEVDWNNEVAALKSKVDLLSAKDKEVFLRRIQKEIPELYRAFKEFTENGSVSRAAKTGGVK